MKKQTFYQIFIFKGSKEKKVIENQGYIISLTNKFDYTTKIALYYESGSWKATHFDLGVDCTPYSDPESYVPKKKWKSKEALIERLKEIDFKTFIERNKAYYSELATIIKEYKEPRCKNCKHLMFSDCYGECSKAYKGIVNPKDSCEHFERRCNK